MAIGSCFFIAGRESLIRLRPFVDARPPGTLAPWEKAERDKQTAAGLERLREMAGLNQAQMLGAVQGWPLADGLQQRAWPSPDILGPQPG